MTLKLIKFNVFFLIISYILSCITIALISYKFFLNDFILLEDTFNKNNLNTFLTSINKNIENLENTTNDYSNWDDTYEFIENGNKKYIYENFREGSQTLEELNLSAIIYVNLDEKILFSKYNNEYLETNQKKFESYLINQFKNQNIANTIINYNSNFIYIAKSEIKKSDRTGETKGFIITVKLVTDETFSKNFSIFKNIEVDKNFFQSNDIEINLKYLNAKIKVSLEKNSLKNHIQFLDENGEYIISLLTTSERELVNNSMKTIYTFNGIVFFILFFIFFFIHRNQYLINNQNYILNKRVIKRTKQLDDAYKELDKKNKKLYEYANTDTLTKIKNRRAYFEESKNILEKSIENNKDFHVIIIDLDNFKKINDTYGHAFGDKILVDFVAIVNSFIGKDTIFARIGGDEFCITFFDKKLEYVVEIAKNIVEKCEKTRFKISNKEVGFTISLGVSSRDGDEDIDKILQKADELLYEAKRKGKNRLITSID